MVWTLRLFWHPNDQASPHQGFPEQSSEEEKAEGRREKKKKKGRDKELKNMKKWYLALGIVFCFIALCLLSLALYFQGRVSANDDLLSKTKGKSIPKMHYEAIVAYNATKRPLIPLLTIASVILFAVGFFLCLIPKIKVSVLTLALLISIPALFSTALARPTPYGRGCGDDPPLIVAPAV